MSSNQISKIPADINLLSNLTTLNLCNNQLTSLSGLSKCKSLKSLIATDNNLTKIDIGTVKLLNTLTLTRNKISDLGSLHKLPMLQKLSLSHNLLPEFVVGNNLQTLQQLRLNSNKMLKYEFSGAKLKILDLGHNPIVKKKVVLKNLGEIRRLENLNLAGIDIEEQEVKSYCPKLVFLLCDFIGGVQL